MAELQMESYEQLRRKEENTYDEIQINKEKIDINHFVISSGKQLLRTVILILTVSLLSAALGTTIIYFTVCAQLQQKLADIDIKLVNIDMKFAEIETKNETKTEEQDSTILDINTLCYNGATFQAFNGSYKCICAAEYLGNHCEYSDGKDTSFMVVFHEGYGEGTRTPKILIASENTAHLSLLYFNSNQNNNSITIDTSNSEYNLNKSVLPSDGIHLAGVELNSDVRINVYGFFYGYGISEGYLSMP
ncbi:NOTCH1 [Mytilus coruscus]|uniref:NOTCH1 n=1 Tax=Mytilus coruscus TaxID=42192 RepID=A0A6J8C4S3_MYTCO|nr:NOTCH1 [Mytilus coruscus]